MSSSSISSPRVSRALYRYMLRSCRFGQNPEIFGHYGSAATSSFFLENTRNRKKDSNNENEQDTSFFFPSASSEVRNILKYAFSSEDKEFSSVDPFSVLRHANESAAILYPSILPLRLPIFDYSASAALPGENLGFNFFEPRYLKLVEMATSKSDGEKGDGYFLLRVGKSPRGGASLLRIIEHKRYKDVIGVHCIAGERINIKEEESIPIDASENSNSSKPLAVATDFDVWTEENISLEKRLSLKEKRAHILKILSNISDLNGTVNRVGLPPINIMEFSFWALRFVLSESDIASRQRWLFSCNGAEERMQYVQDYFETILDRKNL